MKRLLLAVIVILSSVAGVYAQQTVSINPRMLQQNWDAYWIADPDADPYSPAVFLFRKSFELTTLPQRMIVHISADQRYKLYVNGKYVCNGPARGSLLNWNFESTDIAAFLTTGKNTVAALVWNFAYMMPIAQTSSQAGFIIQADAAGDSVLNSNSTWKVIQDTAYSMYSIQGLYAYMAGPGEKFDAAKHEWNWMNRDFNDSAWKPARLINNGVPQGGITSQGLPERLLCQRQVPFMELKKQSFKAIRTCEGIPEASALLQQGKDLLIPANTKVKLLLDQGELTTAYPCLRFSNGNHAEIKLTYAESLYFPDDSLMKRVNTKDQPKGNRDSVDGKIVKGNHDIFIAGGDSNRTLEPLWWRCFRYVQVEIVTKEQSLLIHELNSSFTAYPLQEKAAFTCSDPVYTDIWKTAWHTQRLCTGETFFDCPYYEQLQYVGDTRIQALVTFYASGDTVLWKKAITDFYDSRQSFGLVQCAFPGNYTQFIPTYSLLWIAMINEYRKHCADDALVKKMLPAVMDNLLWFEKYLDSNGMLGKLEWWNFIDWVKDTTWGRGTPPMDRQGNSSIYSLSYVYGLQQAVELMNSYGYKQVSARYQKMISRIKKAVVASCWDAKRQLLADNSNKKNFSQHAQVLAILVDLLPAAQQKKLMAKTYNNDSLVPCSYYFRYYLAEAMQKAGLGDAYTGMLQPWKQMLQIGLTTFAEEPEPSRSDCHAWSASPVYHFLSLICGIQPAAPGFAKVKIAPSLGNLKWVDGIMPHRNGIIHVQLAKTTTGKLSGTVQLPAKLDGYFEWKGKKILLNPGINKINL